MSNTSAAQFSEASVREQADNTILRIPTAQRSESDASMKTRYEQHGHKLNHTAIALDQTASAYEALKAQDEAKAQKISELEVAMAEWKQRFEIQSTEHKTEVDRLRKALENSQTRDKQTIETLQNEKAALERNIATLRANLTKAEESTQREVNKARERVAELAQERDELVGRVNELGAQILDDVNDDIAFADEARAETAKMLKDAGMELDF